MAATKCCDLSGAVELIWQSMVGVPLEPGIPHTPTEADNKKMWVSSVVQLYGDWNGAIRIDCTWDLARQATAHMYGIEGNAVPSDDTCDAVAELTNVIAGMVKPMLGLRSHHSLPTVVRGTRYETTLPYGKSQQQCGFGSGDNCLCVTILKRGARPN